MRRRNFVFAAIASIGSLFGFKAAKASSEPKDTLVFRGRAVTVFDRDGREWIVRLESPKFWPFKWCLTVEETDGTAICGAHFHTREDAESAAQKWIISEANGVPAIIPRDSYRENQIGPSIILGHDY